MSETISFFMLPFLICLILIGIHCFLGLHIIRRGVIFVDLSLAQVAALGTTVGIMCGYEHDSLGRYFISLAFTIGASALFAWTRKVEQKISQEVLIGIVYAFSSAMMILVAANMSHGAEHIRNILVGSILWVTKEQVIITTLIYIAVGVIHYLFRKKLLKVSSGTILENHMWWDFLFFTLFGVVITSSVGIAGILLVFSFLIVPAQISMIIFSRFKLQLFAGWIIGFFIAVIGLVLGYFFDLPVGPVLVGCFTVVPIITSILLPFRQR